MVDMNNDDVAVAPFSSFEFSASGARRKQPLSSVMPVNAGFEYAVILTDAYLRLEGGELQVQRFGQLCSALGDKSRESAIMSARKSGALTEGKKFLLSEMLDAISLPGSVMYVRVDQDGGRYFGEISKEVLLTDIIASQPVATGEFEVCDSKGSWYLRFRDDDAVMFLACRSEIIQKLASKFPENVVKVSSDFIYSW